MVATRRHEPTGSHQPADYELDTLIAETPEPDRAEEYALLEERAEIEQRERDEELRLEWEYLNGIREAGL